VQHNITTYAYRFEEVQTGRSFVYTADTGAIPSVSAFAADADVLVHDTAKTTAETILESEVIPNQYLQEPFKTDIYENYLDRIESDTEQDVLSHHSSAAEAGQVAAEANVDTLVMTHLSPYHDRNGMIQQAREAFDGEIHIAEQGLHLTL
jgi:ribonuclease BN (tRNA processing enzyme)